MILRCSFSSSFCMNPFEYLEIFDPLGIYFRMSLFLFSTSGFSHGEWTWQKYILILNFFSSSWWQMRRMSLSQVTVFISGYLFFIRMIPFVRVRIDTGNIFSRSTTRSFLSEWTRSIPFPSFPELMKSPSMCPTVVFSLIYLGLLSMSLLFLILEWTPFFLRRLGASFFRCASIFLPYGLLIYARIVTPETTGSSLWYFLILCAVSSGDWSSRRYSSVVFWSSGWRAIVFGRVRVYLLLTYAWWSAYMALYLLPFLLRFVISYESELSLIPISFAISFWEIFRFKRDSITLRSPREICSPLFLFSFWKYTREFEFYL